MTTPCAWEPIYSQCPGGSSEFLDDLDSETRQAVIDMAVEHLWRWTGRRLGVCRYQIRPCMPDCADQQQVSTYWGRGPFPGAPSAQALTYACGRCDEPACTCLGGDSVRLPGPVHAIIEVSLDGQIMPTASWAQVGPHLVRLDGGRWPRCQDVTAPLTEPGSWAVTYDQGVSVPVGGRIAAGILADQFARALCGGDCALPQRVQSVTRQGVTVAVLDSFEDVAEGRTGIWLIDSWVASMTSGTGSAPRVLTPESLARRGPRARAGHRTRLATPVPEVEPVLSPSGPSVAVVAPTSGVESP